MKFNKVKFFLYLTKHYALKTYGGSGYIDARILDQDTS
jgi:hypothetical protein